LIANKPEENQNPEEEINQNLEEETIDLPFIGKIETKKFSLPILTFLIAITDGFNPCAFFVLTFLLAALIGLSGARRKILLVGGILYSFQPFLLFVYVSFAKCLSVRRENYRFNFDSRSDSCFCWHCKY